MPRNQFDININLRGFPEAQANLDKTKQGMDRMRISTSGLKRQIGALRNNMLLYAFTIGAIERTTNNLIATYRQQIEAERLLENNLKNIAGVSSEASANLKELASGLQQVTTFGDEAIISAQSLLATFQLSEATIAQLTPRILDMSAAMGTDLRSSAILLGKAFIGETSRLKQIGLVIDETGLAMARAKGPIEEAAFLLKTFDDNFRGAAKALRETPLGELDGLNMALGDLTEQLGRTAIPLDTFLAKLKLAAVQGITTWAFFFTEWSKLSKGGLGDVLLIDDAFDKAMKRVQNLMYGTTKSVEDFGEASVNASNQASEAEAKRQETIDKSLESLNKEKNALTAKIAAMEGADLVTVRMNLLNRELTQSEIDLIKQIEIATKTIEARQSATKEQEQFQKKFNSILLSTKEGEIAHLNSLIEKINANKELIATDTERTLVVEELRNKIKELQEDEPLKDMAENSGQLANGILAAARAMKTLRDDTEVTQGEILQTIGSLLMLFPGGQVPGAVIQSLGMFTGHTGGLIRNNGIQRFAQGGMVQGQDNVPILAQAGEFIMRREAVQNIGVENLAEMNRGQSPSSVTVNIQGNMIGNDEFVRDNLIPQIQKVSRQGLA
jgi:hypothetical protein